MIIQARMGSTRLPGKSMFFLAGKPLLYRIIERVKRCKRIDEIVLAIPNTPENDCLEYFAQTVEISVFRGSESNLLDRYLKAAKHFNGDTIIRLPADNATPEPVEIDKIVNFHLKSNYNGFSTNLAQAYDSGYPDGIGAEVFSLKSLEIAAKHQPTAEQLEHIHLNFFDYSKSS